LARSSRLFADLDLDLAPNFHEVGRRKVEQIDGSHRVPEQEGEKHQTAPQQPSASFAKDDSVMRAEVNGGVEIDGAAEIFCRSQHDGRSGISTKP
jgi:hypothetical protein